MEECKSAAKSLGATLRAQASSHLRKYIHFRDGWAPDRRWTETTEGGTIPRKYNDWVEATARPSRWICGPTLSIGKPVKPLQRTNHCHYFCIMVTTTIVPNAAPFPNAWHRPLDVVWGAGGHRGGIARSTKTPSHPSWLPASSHAKSVKSYRSWLPSSTIMKAKASLPTTAQSNKTKHSSARSIRIAKPCKSVPYNKRPYSWNCPERHTPFQGTYGSVMGSRLHHWRGRRPEKPVETLIHTKPLPYAVSHQLPTDQQDWKCPLCTAALPFLPRYDRQKAIQQHVTECWAHSEYAQKIES